MHRHHRFLSAFIGPAVLRERGVVIDAAVRALSANPARTALLVDFDGTLAPIVDHPDDAVPLPGVTELLDRLVGRFGVVGVVSGRPVGFLLDALPVPGLELVGQYGMERWDGTRVVVDRRADAFVDAVSGVATRAAAELPGVFVERKGAVAVTLHWRRAPEMGPTVRRWADAAAAEHRLTIYPTKMAVELRPPVPVDKGSAAAGLAAGMDAAMFAGDDHGDLSAFDALTRLRTIGALTHVVLVAVRSAEEPRELVARSDLAVDGPAALVAWLSRLADAVDARG